MIRIMINLPDGTNVTTVNWPQVPPPGAAIGLGQHGNYVVGEAQVWTTGSAGLEVTVVVTPEN